VKREQIEVTVRAGSTLLEVAKNLEDLGIVSKTDFISACGSERFKKYEFINNIPKVREKYFKLEGYLFPDTYMFFKDESVFSVIDKFLGNFSKKLEIIEEFLVNSQFDLDEILTIASILQRECDVESATGVASVMYNRLSTLPEGKSEFGEFGMNRLQSDPTVYYPYKNQNSAPDGFISKYDTYSISGLPPGAICSPELDFIIAALKPEKTNFYYFVTSPEGKAFFARTYQEHKENFKKLR
jgi:UPF0755 protein